MNRTDILNQIQKNVERLSASDLPEYKYIPLHQKPSPSVLSLPGSYVVASESYLSGVLRFRAGGTG